MAGRVGASAKSVVAAVVVVVATLAVAGESFASGRGSLPSGGIALVVGGGLEVVDARSGARREVATGVLAAPAWSPEGKALAFVAADAFGEGARLRVVRLGSARQRTVARVGEGLTAGAAWSPDGRRLALTLATSRGTRLVTVGRDGHARRAVARGASAFEPARWSPNGRRLAFVGVGSPASLWSVAADGRGRRLLEHGVLDDSEASFSWSPDGRHLAFVGTSGEVPALVVVGAGGQSGRRRVLAAATSGRATTAAGNVTWSPRGGRIAFIRWRSVDGSDRAYSELCVADVRRGAVRTLVHLPFIDEVSWSPDGRWLAYLTEDAGPSDRRYLRLVRADGARDHRLATFTDDTSGLAWQPPTR